MLSLLVSQIQPLLILQLEIIRPSSKVSLLLVLMPAISVNEQHVNQTGTPAADDGYFYFTSAVKSSNR